MDQIKIGAFLKELRKEKQLTQEQLSKKLNVSNRTVSRWETGSNMPDIGMLIEIADFFDVSIPEIVSGERKSENMNKETRKTAAAMAEYGRNAVKIGKQRVVGILMSGFGIFIIVSALSIFPSDSSWGSIYSILGSVFLVAGIYHYEAGGGKTSLTHTGNPWMCLSFICSFYAIRLYCGHTVQSGAEVSV